MPLLLLAKHSMPAVTAAVAARDWPLSIEGKRRCDWLAKALQPLQPTALYASPEPKARETAELVGASLGVTARCVDGLRENDRTNFPYLRRAADFERRIRVFFDSPDERLIGRETANEALARFSAAVAGIVAEHPGETICIAAHGAVISLFAAHFNTVPAFEIWTSLNPLPAYITLSLPDFQMLGRAIGFHGSA
jgi:broad specificity phosphatase PhoE